VENANKRTNQKKPNAHFVERQRLVGPLPGCKDQALEFHDNALFGPSFALISPYLVKDPRGRFRGICVGRRERAGTSEDSVLGHPAAFLIERVILLRLDVACLDGLGIVARAEGDRARQNRQLVRIHRPVHELERATLVVTRGPGEHD
jgi:hypothetical protein